MTTESIDTPAHVRALVEKFFDQDIAFAVNIIEDLPEAQAAQVLEMVSPGMAVRVIRRLQVGYAATLLGSASSDALHTAVSKADPQLATAILMHMDATGQERMAGYLSGKTKSAIGELLSYPEGSVGRIMTTDFLSFHKEMTAHDAVERIRQLSRQKRTPVSYAYVTDDDSRLIGVLNMRDLMLADSHQPLAEIMIRDVFTVHCFMDKEEAGRDMAKRKYFAAPVVDGQGRILGIIKAERMIHGVHEQVTKDLQKMFGAGGDERAFSSIAFSLKKRLPWLHINLATAFLAAAVVALFESTIARITILAVFLPVVAGQGGNAGAQSLAVVMRGLVMREIPKEKVANLILKEGVLGAVNGVVIGVVTAAVAYLWYGNPYLGLVIGLGMFFNLIFAGLSGASIPIVMKKLGLDPAQSSSIILTTVTDVLGFIAFLGFAVIFQRYLV